MSDSRRPSQRPRLALAAAVAAACLVAGIAILALLTGAPSDPSGQQAERLPKAVPVQARRHASGVPGLSEKQLREIETVTLGPEHAREHAMLRAALRRRPGGAPKPPATGPMARIAAVDGDPAEIGRWDAAATVTFPIIAIHTAMLPTGKVMIWSFPKSPYQNSAQAWLWNPADGQLVRKDPPMWLDPTDGVLKPANIWCSGHTFTADGELVVFGGNLAFATATKDYKGLNKVYTFNPFTETWREQPDMRHGRWYPSGVRLADGRIPILSGLDESGNQAMNTDVELFSPSPSLGGLGTTSLIGSTGGAGQPPTGEYYPHMFAMPSGRTLVAGPDSGNTWFFDSVGTNSFTWSDYPDLSRRRVWGTAVPVPAGPGGSTKIMALGGTDYSVNPSSATTEVFDESNPGQGWRAAPSNVIGRGHANTVLLPDGSMVEVGGGVGNKADAPSPHHWANPEQRQIELWDPQTGQWRLGPAQAEYRAYHSTAVLLPDGRVLSAGDDWNGGIESDTGELYQPPYLFRGPRPTITSAPAAIKVGANFGVETPNANITRAALVAPGSTTHAVDMNQRFVPLAVTQRSGCVDLAAPPNVNAAPPGYYMLFLLNDQGVPSVAKFVKLQTGGSPSTCQGPPPPPDTIPPSVSLTAPAGGATVSGPVDMTASAADNVGVAGVRFKVDGQNVGSEDTSSPYGTTWDSTGVSNGPHELTATARDAIGNTTTSSPVTVTVANAGPPDTTLPSVSLTAPANGSTVSGTTSVSATASDNVGVAGVQFKLDGNALGPEDGSAPFSVAWNTTDAMNGSHALTATARDAAGNTKTSTGFTVTVNNPVPPAVDPSPEPAPGIPPSKAGPPVAKQPATPPGGTRDLAPGISRLRLIPSTFWRSSKISFQLTEAGRVRLSFERKLAGERVRGKCLRPTRKRRRACTRSVQIKTTLTLQGKAGANSMRFDARLSRGRGLEPGRYRLTLLATDAGGKVSAPARADFQLVARTKARRASLIEGALAQSSLFGTFS